MSSFIGHGLAAVTAYSVVEPRERPFVSTRGALLWFTWLIILAWMPDIDHVVPALTMSQNSGLRITHAFASSLLLPAITLAVLARSGLRQQRLRVCAWQAVAAGLSHPIMDWLVGVIGLPLFWPFHQAVIFAPIGLLPSAGSPHWQNYYFYENLFIELGILLPLMVVSLGNLPWRNNTLRRWQSIFLLGIASCFLYWSMGLSR
ncbi:MAG: metal-dependent hydrolase [Cyanobacteria bacterium P01_F01_bin.86]